MARDLSGAARRGDIEALLESTLADATADCLEPARTAVLDHDDRWYGEFLLATHDAVSAAPSGAGPIRAAASIELMGAYCRLRGELLLGDGPDQGSRRRVTPALLAGDYLYSAAYSTLGAAEGERRRECFDVLSDVSESVIEALAGDAAAESTAEYCSLVDRTAGAIGAGAARLGVTLAGGDDDRADLLATVGRRASTIRYLGPALVARSPVGPDAPDERTLRHRADRRRRELDRSLRDLSDAVPTESLRSLVDERLAEVAPDGRDG